MNQLLHDVRYGVRMLRRSPGFTVLAVLILGVGIGATATVFTITNAMFFRPLSGRRTSDPVRLYSRDRTDTTNYRRFSYPNFEDIRQRTDLFAELAAYRYDFIGIIEGTTTRRYFAGFVSESFFPLLRVSMAHGRAFTPEDDRPGATPVVVVSHEYWTARGADPDLVGSTLVVGGRPRTVVGIAPPGFSGTMAVTAPPLWLPLGQTAGGMLARTPETVLRDRGQHLYSVVGRLADGLTLESVAPALDVVSRALEQAFPAENRNRLIEAHPIPRLGDSGSPSDETPIAVAMAFAVAMAAALLLIVALNLTNILLARGGLRHKELAVRLAVGAGRSRVVRQLLVESSLLAVAGGLLGLGVAYVASGLIASTLMPVLPMFQVVFDPTPDLRVLGATLAFATFATLVFGLGPALRLSRVDLLTALKEQVHEPRGRAGLGRTITRNGLVVTQVALSLALLTAGGLFFFGAVRARAADPGFSLDRGIVIATDARLAGYERQEAWTTLLRVLDRLRQLNGVESASFASTIPYGESVSTRSVQPAGSPADAPGIGSTYRVIGADYFRTLGVAVQRGREFTLAEESATEAAPVAIVDVGLANRLWPGADPIGRRVQFVQGRDAPATPTYEVVGVVGNMKRSLFDVTPPPHVYVPFGGRQRLDLTFHVRGKASGPKADAALLANVGETIRSVDPNLPVVSLKTFVEHRDTGWGVWFIRMAAKVFAVLGLVAMAVAMVGVYGVRAIMVGRRTREFGIRVAIGATPNDVLRLVMTEGSQLILIGIGVGLLLSAGLSRVLAGWIYGIRTFEPGVFVTTSLLLALAMLAACYVPARRAAAVEPATALRNE